MVPLVPQHPQSARRQASLERGQALDRAVGRAVVDVEDLVVENAVEGGDSPTSGSTLSTSLSTGTTTDSSNGFLHPEICQGPEASLTGGMISKARGPCRGQESRR